MVKAALWVAVALTVGCEYRSINDGMQTGDDIFVPGTDGGLPPGTILPGGGNDRCEPVSQSCGGGQRCNPSCDMGIYSCVPRMRDGNGTQGFVCTLDDDCQRGFVCVNQLARSGNNATRCARYCRGASDCTDGSRCTTSYLHCQRAAGSSTISRYLCVSPAGR